MHCWRSPRYLNLTDLYAPSRRLQDHERIERCDAAIAAHVPSRVGRAAADCDLERDRGVCGGGDSASPEHCLPHRLDRRIHFEWLLADIHNLCRILQDVTGRDTDDPLISIDQPLRTQFPHSSNRRRACRLDTDSFDRCQIALRRDDLFVSNRDCKSPGLPDRTKSLCSIYRIADPDCGCDRFWVRFGFDGNASGGSGSYTYSWDLGNGVTRTGQSFSYTYPVTDTGSRTITLTVTDSASNTATDSVTIQINSPAVLFSCFINETCNSPYTSVLALSAQDDAHAEIIGGGNYPYKLCCANVSSVQTTTGKGTCDTLGAGFTGLITLSGDTNAQVERYNYTGTDGFDNKKNVCVKLTSGSLNCTYVDFNTCKNILFWKTIISLSGQTNAHIGNYAAYSDLVLCCKEPS